MLRRTARMAMFDGDTWVNTEKLESRYDDRVG
jgi:hypothetical protein